MEKLYKPVEQLVISADEFEYARKLESNNMNPAKAVFISLLQLGTQSIPEQGERKYIKSANLIFLLTAFTTVLYLAFAVFWENLKWIELLTLAEFISVGALVLNGYGKVNLSRWVFIAGINTTIFVSALLIGPVAHLQNCLMITAVLPFLIFDSRKTVHLAVAAMLPMVLLYVFAEINPNYLSYNLSLELQSRIETAGLFVQTMILVAMFLQLVQNIRETQDDLSASQAQMQMQTSELKRSNSDLEQFAYIVSHDLKAPVRNISSFMNLLLNKYGPTMSEEAREFVSYSHMGSKRLERLIDDVLAYCRIGTNLPQPVPVNLNDVVKTIEFELREKLNAAQAAIHINKELPIVNHVHASLMYHIFQNLISNGLKFNRKDHPEIVINWTNSLNHYAFSVKDNGIGISKEYSTTIFQMFKRLHHEHEYDGTGIGLAICKKIVEHYHGEIWFESKEGEGTTFHFTIRKF